MKHAMLVAVALAGLMEEHAEGGTVTAGGQATEPPPGAPNPGTPETAPDVADTSGDRAGEPANASLDAPAAKPEEAKPAEAAAPTGDEYADACNAGTPRVALVGKYGDRTPVQLKNAAHLAKLQADHGESSVEVQP